MQIVSALPEGLDPSYHAVKVFPATLYTMGDIEIDENARVLNKKGNAIEGLFAAGEVTAGVRGVNRFGGNAILDAIVFEQMRDASQWVEIYKAIDCLRQER